MTKPIKAQKEASESNGARFREGYYRHHRLGQGRLCTNEENKACMKVVLLVLDRNLAEVEGHERIRGILHTEVPF